MVIAPASIRDRLFSEADVRLYRQQYQSMKATGARTAMLEKQIARRHGVTVQAVHSMIIGNSYRWIS